MSVAISELPDLADGPEEKLSAPLSARRRTSRRSTRIDDVSRENRSERDFIRIAGTTLGAAAFTEEVISRRVNNRGRRVPWETLPHALTVTAHMEVNGYLATLGKAPMGWVRTASARQGYLTLTAMAQVAERNKCPVLYLTVSPPHVDREHRREFWRYLSDRITRVMRERAHLPGGVVVGNMWEVSASVDEIHPHRNLLVFPVEKVTASDPAWKTYRADLQKILIGEIKRALVNVTGESRVVSEAAVHSKFLDEPDVSYFFKKTDPHAADSGSWAWGDILRIAAMDTADEAEVLASERARDLYDQVEEIARGVHLFSLSKNAEHLTGWIADALMDRDEVDLWNTDEDIRSEVERWRTSRNRGRVAKYSSLDEYLESAEESMTPVEKVLRRPLAWMVRRHREDKEKAFVDHFRAGDGGLGDVGTQLSGRDPMVGVAEPDEWDREWPAARYSDEWAVDVDGWPAEEPVWDRGPVKTVDLPADVEAANAEELVASLRGAAVSMMRDADSLKRQAARVLRIAELAETRLESDSRGSGADSRMT